MGLPVRSNDVSKIASSLEPQLSDGIAKLRERDLLEAAMATSALVAMADHRVQLDESLALGAVVENAELLKIYDLREAVDLYSSYVELIRANYEQGRQAALKVIARCADDLAAAELLVKVGIAIAKADDQFCKAELDVVDEICASLGITGLDPLALAGDPAATRSN